MLPTEIILKLKARLILQFDIKVFVIRLFSIVNLINVSSLNL
jgi:hypothetical protein